MRAHFQGQNILALGNGVAVLKSAWMEAEPPAVEDENKQKLKRGTAKIAVSAKGKKS